MHVASSHNTHPINPGMGCKSCNLPFSLNNLQKHIRDDHSIGDIPPNRVSVITRITKSSSLEIIARFEGRPASQSHVWSDLKSQVLNLQSYTPQSCSTCEAVFPNKTDPTRHASTHRGWKPLVCPRCDCKNNYNSNLKKPLEVQTDEQPTHCLSCSYTSQEDHQFTRHVRTNTEVKPHQCEWCGHKMEIKPDLEAQVEANHKDNTKQNDFATSNRRPSRDKGGKPFLFHNFPAPLPSDSSKLAHLLHLLPFLFFNLPFSSHANVHSNQLPKPSPTQKTPRPPGRGSQATVLLLLPFNTFTIF